MRILTYETNQYFEKGMGDKYIFDNYDDAFIYMYELLEEDGILLEGDRLERGQQVFTDKNGDLFGVKIEEYFNGDLLF